MPHPPLVRRVEILEEKVDALSLLPERVSAIERQLVALRDDVTSLRDDVKSLRDDVESLRDDVESLRGDVKSFRDEFTSRDEFTLFRTEVRAEFVAVRAEIAPAMKKLAGRCVCFTKTSSRALRSFKKVSIDGTDAARIQHARSARPSDAGKNPHHVVVSPNPFPQRSGAFPAKFIGCMLPVSGKLNPKHPTIPYSGARSAVCRVRLHPDF